MGGTFFIFLITISHVLLLLNSVIAMNLKKGFSMKMNRIDSKESLLYLGDHLTRDERIQRLVEQSKFQARYIELQILVQRNSTSFMNLDVVRMPVVYEPRMFYVVRVGLGTFPGRRESSKSYSLMVDTGSDKTWLQCEGATKYFHQDMPLYPWNSSTTYRPVPCNTHPVCTGDNCNIDGQCTYVASYMTGSVTSGIFAEEKLTTFSDTGGRENIKIHMGCGFLQENFEKFIGYNHLHGQPDVIAGILGLGSGNWSFINQLGAAGQGKFSYCFEIFNPNIPGSDTYLRFGADATIGGAGQRVYTTPIVVPEFRTQLYYLYLEDISVGKRKVGFPRGAFKLQSQGEGGTVIDSGAPISIMYKDHFDRVADLIKEHFNDLGIEYIGSHQNFNVCFRLRGRFDISKYPSITLHFQRADYVIPDYKADFIIFNNEIVCLGISRGNTNTPTFILGAMQQANKRILYNFMDSSLSFSTEYCELDS